ncbi:stress response translation initiation inhibitor YciH [halophilic archaeon]|uniref:stress response translation initiation inhibitor YciH n=1 Tax=Halomicrococcus sp. SG-WS-1 TaxID=3439057 RepID=UPI000DDD3B5D|nr:translation initiation factor [halophilic archaeon]
MPEDDDLSSITGLPEELGIEEDLGRTEQRITIRTEKRRYDKPVTIVTGLDPNDVDVGDLASELKSKVASGGTVNDDDEIELQGDHRDRVREILTDKGFTVE